MLTLQRVKEKINAPIYNYAPSWKGPTGSPTSKGDKELIEELAKVQKEEDMKKLTVDLEQF